MFNLVYNCSLHIHNCSPLIHFGSGNRRGKDCQANIGCNVVRLCTLMSYDYRCSCRTFIAPHVVRHGNLIKQSSDTAVFCCSNIQRLRQLSFNSNRSSARTREIVRTLLLLFKSNDRLGSKEGGLDEKILRVLIKTNNFVL